MKLNVVLAICLLLVQPLCAQRSQFYAQNVTASAGSTIAQIGGAGNNGGSAATGSVTYTVAAGHTVVLTLETATNASSLASCLDNNLNALSAGATKTQTNDVIYVFYVLSSPGSTSFTCAWTTSAIWSIMVEDYTGVGSVNTGLSGNTGSGVNQTSQSLTVTLDDANDWNVCGFSDGSVTLAAATGNQRQQVTAGSARAVLVDNTAASATSVTCSSSSTSVTWAGASIELKHS